MDQGVKFKVARDKLRVIILGAGPAGLSCAYYLTKRGHQVTILEKDQQVGGISKTINLNGNLFDIGGHRFFTKSQEVWKLWKEFLPEEKDFLLRNRKSRIYFNKKFFDYPLEIKSILANFQLSQLIYFLLSYLIRGFQKKQQMSLENSLIQKFGLQLYRTFFKSYSEKVWGRKCHEISADWSSQRIQGLSLISAILTAMTPKRFKKNSIKTLLDQFHYPRLGPGMMWEKAEELIKKNGGEIILNEKVLSLSRSGEEWRVGSAYNNYQADVVISTIPFNHLFHSLNVKNPEIMLRLERLKFRNYIMIAVVVKAREIFDDNWIYIQEPSLKVCRVQNFKNWSPYMVTDPELTTLGLEYFCDAEDDIWKMDDDLIIHLATNELLALGFTEKEKIIDTKTIRVSHAYPIYHLSYREDLNILKETLLQHPSLYTVGRGGMFRYNNQDHSIMSAILTCENILGESTRDPWSVNQDAEYIELKEIK